MRYFSPQSEEDFSFIVLVACIVVLGLILPICLIPIITFFPYSEIVEEVSKFFVVLFFILKLPASKTQLIVSGFFGVLFSVSESMLYLSQIIQFGDLSVFFERLLWVTPMHVLTVILMTLTGLASRWLLVFGLVAAIVLHALYNSWATMIVL
jgi:hypothetical protein